jgi:hypothetical protein
MSKARSRLVRALDHAYAQKCRVSSVAGPVEACPLPKLSSHPDGINLVGLPPCGLIPVSMENSMMGPAKWDGVLVAHPAAERAQLREPKVMSIRRPPAACDARLRRHEPEVRAVAVTARFAERECAFDDMPRNGIPYPLFTDRTQFVRALWCRSRLGRGRAKLDASS